MRRRIAARGLVAVAVVAACGALAAPASAQTLLTKAWTKAPGTTAGRLIVERPTLLSLGFEWMIEGDANVNAKVDVEFRKTGQAAWRKALPLIRLRPDGPENVFSDLANHRGLAPYRVPNAFAGSILNLEPGTSYEAKFTLSDPDGVTGEAVKTTTVKTRKEPMPSATGKVYHVYPYDWDGGPKVEGSFIGLLRAYYMGLTNGDVNNAFPARVQPGDTILVHAGVYRDKERNNYGNNAFPRFYGVEFDGTYYLRKSGTPDKPIAIKAAGDGEVVFDGDGVAVLFDITAANYTYFEGITFRNVGTAIQTGRKEMMGASGLTVKHCKFEDVGRGIFGEWAGSKDFYIADSVFLGRHDTTRLLGWGGPYRNYPGFPPPINGPGGSEFAVKLHGQGHVVAYNRIVNWHDGIDNATYGAPDGSPDNVIEENVPGSVDYYGNEMDNFADNCFEVDGGVRNMRIFRNRCFNSASSGLSYEPSYGGPFYAFQNIVYNNITGSLKGAWGAVLYQNTIFGEIHPRGDNYPSNQHYRNNLLIALGSSPEVLSLVTQYSTSDYNGFLLNAGSTKNFLWFDITKQKLPEPSRAVAESRRPAPPEFPGFKTLEEYSKATGQDTHSIIITYDDFVKVTGINRSDPTILYKPENYDFHLKPTSKAVDAGMLLPTINDDFTGKAPDLGAYEAGRPVPHYGPRTPPPTVKTTAGGQ